MPDPAEQFTCPRCGHTSAEAQDVRWGWCGRCQDHTRGETVTSPA